LWRKGHGCCQGVIAKEQSACPERTDRKAIFEPAHGACFGPNDGPTNDTDSLTANVCAPSRHPGEAALDDLTGDCFFARKLRSLIAMTPPRKRPVLWPCTGYSADAGVIPH
jgi:hypothetical protein